MALRRVVFLSRPWFTSVSRSPGVYQLTRHIQPYCRSFSKKLGWARDGKAAVTKSSAQDTAEPTLPPGWDEECAQILAAYPKDAYTRSDLMDRADCKQHMDDKNFKGVVDLAKSGSRFACGYLGALYLLGDSHGIETDYEKARRWVEKGAEGGDFECLYYYPLVLEEGYGGPKEEKQAREWYQKGTERGNSDSMARLGTMWKEGRGGEQCVKTAGKYYEMAANAGNAEACLNLSQWYLEGHGPTGQSDHENCAKWITRAQELDPDDDENTLTFDGDDNLVSMGKDNLMEGPKVAEEEQKK